MLSNMLTTWMTMWALLSSMKFLLYLQFQNDHRFQFLLKCFMWFLAHDFCLSIMHYMEWTSWYSQQTKEVNNKDVIWHLLILKSNLQDFFLLLQTKENVDIFKEHINCAVIKLSGNTKNIWKELKKLAYLLNGSEK